MIVGRGALIKSVMPVEDWLATIPKTGLIVVWGYSRKHIVALKRHAPRARIVVIDPTKEAYIQHGWAEIAPNYHLTAIPEWKSAYPAEWVKFMNRYAKDYQTMVLDVITAARFSYEWMRNYIYNARFIPDSYPVGSLFGTLNGGDLILVGTGPSLDESLDDLRWAKGKALIVTCGSALKKLLDNGIEPDLVAVFDGGIANYKCHFEGLESNIPLVYDPMVHHRILEEYHGPLILMRVWPNDTLVRKPLGIETGFAHIGPSVSNTIVNLAEKFGAGRVLMVGQDLSLRETESGLTSHARDTNNYNTDLRPTTKVYIDVPGKDGVVKTTITLNAFRHVLAAQSTQVAPELVNCSAYGATIDNVRWSTLRDEIRNSRLPRMELNKVIGRADRLAHYYAKARAAGSRLEADLPAMKNLDVKTWDKIIKCPSLAVYYFGFNLAWEGNLREKGEEWVKEKLKQVMTYANPRIHCTISALSKISNSP